MNTIPTPAARFRCLRLAPLLLFAAVLRAELPATYAAGDLEGLEEKLDDADVSALLGEKPKRDFDLLQTTHLSMLAAWDQAKEGGMSTLIAVPEDGAYRVSLRHVVGFEAPFPVTLTLTPQTTDAGPGLTHVFGQLVLAGGKTGKQQEQTLPIRFETETQLIAVPSDNTMVWEYWDTDLPKGVYRATLTKADPQVRAHALLLTRSKDFRPSLSSFPKDRTLGRVYMRFKATETNSKSGGTFAVNAGLGYHWRGRRPPGAH